MTSSFVSDTQKYGQRSKERKVDISDLFDKLPPNAIEAECALLGSIILDYRVCGEVVQLIETPEEFYKPAHAAIYEVLVELYDQVQSIDMVLIKQALSDRGILEQVGGLDYLIELAESVPSAASANYYAVIVHDKAALRKLIESTGKILHDCYNSSDPVGELLDSAERAIFEIAESKSTQEAAELGELLQETYDKLSSDEGMHTGVETGFFELDEMTNGLQPGDLIILAARPSMGKTALALNMAEHMAATTKQPCAVFSLEMSRQQLAQRLLSSRSGVDSQKMRRNTLSKEDFEKLALTVGQLSEAPFYIDDTPGLTLLGLRAKARRLVTKHGIKAIFVDYLQLMSAPGSESRQQEVSNLSRGIKALARELNVPVICLSQLNRAAEQREGHRPRMSDLRESGSIEQDADVVMMLHRESYFHRGEDEWAEQNPEKVNEAELIMAKQRNGPAGMVRLTFDGATTRFHNATAKSYG